MNKLTKLLSVFVIAGAIGAGVAGVAGCKKSNGHTHKYTYTVDVEDATKHNGVCDCGKDPIIKQGHVDTKDSDGNCDLCGAPVQQQSTEVTVTGVTVTAAGGANSVAEDGSLQLSASVTGTGNPAQTVTWSSSDNAKATVSATGLVTGVKEGTVTITATSTVDTSKSGTINLTVTAKGTVDPGPTDKSLYEQLISKENVRVQIDKQAATGTKLGAFDVATAGIYVNGSTGYEAETGVEYAEEGEVKVLKQVTAHPGEEGKPNVYTVINPGPVKGEVEGVFSTKTSHVGSASEFIVFNGDNSIKLALSKSGDNGALTCNYEGGSAAAEGVTVKVGEYIEVYFKLNLTEGKTTLKINGKTVLDDVATGMTVFNYVQLSASNKGQRVHTTKDIVICGAPKTLADSKTEANAIIDAELAKYNAADYTTNGSDLTAAVTTAKAAVEAAEDVAAVNKAVADCKAALKAVLKDSDIAAARTKALNELKAKYPATRFTYTGLTEGDAKYNNVKLYEDKILEVTTALESKNTAAEMKVITDAADTYLATVTNAAMLTAKITEVKTELSTYAEDYKTEHCAGDEAKIAAADRAVLAQNTVLEGSTDIADANENLAEAKAAVAKAVTDVGRDPQEIIDEAIATISAYKSIEIAAIEADYTAYKTVIGEAKTAASEGVTADNADSKVSTLKNTVDCYLANYAAHKTADAYKTTEANKVKNNTVKAKIEALDFLETFKEVKATETATAAEARALAAESAQKQVDDIVASLASYKVAVTVGENEVCYVTYGTKLTLGDLRVSGFNVSAATLGGKNITENEQDDEDLTVYNPVEVTVTGKSDIAGFKTSEKWQLANLVDGANGIIANNNLFTATGELEYTADGPLFAPSSGVTAFGDSYGKNVISLKNIPSGGNNSGKNGSTLKPLTITVDCALSSLSAKVIVADSSGKTKRAGKLHIEVNGVEVVTVNDVVWGTKATDKLENLKMGDVVTIWAENTGSGGRFYVAEISAEADASKIAKTVTVEWQNGDGTAWKTTTHHYFEAITAPTATDSDKPSGAGTQTGWNYNGAALSADLKLASSGTAYVMTPVFATNDITINYTDGTSSETLGYLSTASNNALPDPESGDETHLFIGYYLQAGEAPADSDTVFDLSTATAGTYTVYAKYLEANVHITYVDSVNNTSETVHLFKKADGSLVDADDEAATVIEDPETPTDGQHMFLGYYLQAGDEPADTDVVFSLTGLTADTYTVYAKYLESNVHITYKDNADDAGETVHLFKTKDSLVTVEGEAAKLKSAPTAPEDAPEFKGWVYTVDDEEVVLKLADLKAGDTITVTAKFGVLEVSESHLNQDNMPTDAVAANGNIVSTDLFTVDALLAMNAKSQASNKALTLKEANGDAIENASTFSGKFLQTANNDKNLGYCISITAKYAISLDIYYNLNKGDLTQDGRTANFQYVIDDGDVTSVSYKSVNKGYNKLTVTLQKGEVLKVGFTGANNATTFFSLFGIDADLVNS